MENVIILGNGISGLTAAIYTARANLEPLVISGPESGGQLTLTTDVENFPGFENGIMGPELVEQSRKQAERFGARFKMGIATGFEQKDDHYVLTIDGKEEIETKTVIVTTGASARWLGLESEKTYKGRGVTSCATCDGYFFRDKEVIVIGGGDSAMEEATFLTKFCSKVTVIHRRDELRASKIMQDRFLNHEKTDIIWNSQVIEILGDGKSVTGVKLKDTKTGEEREFPCSGVFLAIGHIPNTKIFKDKLDMDDHSYLITDRYTKTNLPGVFAGGDVQDTRYRQAITAAGSGCAAALEAEKYLAERE